MIPTSLYNRFNTQVSKTATHINPAALGQDESIQHKRLAAELQDKRLSLAEKLLQCEPLAHYQQHALHFVLKSLGYLPAPLLENFVSYLKGPTSKQYLHANAHLRLILAVNGKLKKPLQLSKLAGLRQRFAADAVAMQDPKVWRQASSNRLNQLNFISKKDAITVHWQDKQIADADDGEMRVRCYRACADSTNPPNPDEVVMLYFHGGGFCIGDADTHHEFCHTLCAQTGWAVVSVDYRLAPEHAAPTALRDGIAAYQWLSQHSHTLGASSARIVLAGDSAGGCLANLIAQQVTTVDEQAWSDLGVAGQKTINQLQNLPPPLAQLPLYPVTDTEIDYPSWALYGQGLLLDHDDIVVFSAAYMQRSPLHRRHVLVSPMLGDNRQLCPTYIVAAELDILRDEAFAYAEQLQSHGIKVNSHTVMGAPHGFIHFMSVHQGIKRETEYIIADFARFVAEIIEAQLMLAA